MSEPNKTNAPVPDSNADAVPAAPPVAARTETVRDKFANAKADNECPNAGLYGLFLG